MRKVLVLPWVCAACVAGEGSSRQPRWPEHRKIEEKRITDLESSVVQLQHEVDTLRAALRELQGQPAAARITSAATIDRELVAKAVAPVKTELKACGELSGMTGTVNVVARVAPDGHVFDVSVASTSDQALGNCVAGVVKTLQFPVTVAGGTFSYPFVF